MSSNIINNVNRHSFFSNAYHNDLDGDVDAITNGKLLLFMMNFLSVSKVTKFYRNHDDKNYERHMHYWLDTNSIELSGTNDINNDNDVDEINYPCRSSSRSSTLSRSRIQT